MMKVFTVFLFLLVATFGCTTKSKSQAQAQAAFASGQQQAFAQMQQQKQSHTVKFLGPVKNEIIPWTEDLTLTQAIVAAEYRGIVDPKMILIIRDGQRIPVNPKQLIRGEDFPLQAGDTVEIR
ncbi:MAG: hypothetical protein M3Y82_12660 [Verrucomicrobiota bacterium]|nr:hypothetical protein [Verrucomicrobiota bacterium]